MKVSTVLAIIGGIITILGIVFHFQGQSVIGPESSFMYSNPDWITYGLQIMIVGVIITVSGAILRATKRN
ncbi:hypothetical protein AAA799E16_01160 [Marine Group I thaumarchaeote SCGC AAA799-E16]|uniref:Uncharacterized protein n=5 Tax=Marine Group I TaxID=905826 RepID=A0A087S6H8_9ARCH|nr:hypothetical protein AAA799N04_00887 [Marine Group I thaumarchaeote SCGC AAA799-N04]KER06150.1 hypothetical protein AAA799E16_01160 [Marine Group I thaumarchaeote SCGC AAA799-E16]KFM15886.1 hypothetical protein AAA799D11_01044 [Marine Group I thaumarchaeote SCGC AAA799-D11]KFM17451.1 hypothetical protein SCCGRSA3_01919 [Marine Group I thaumarchaeote SCGC RSA3]KFM21332.1 hypothetical protein AAA799B03_01107 [Marine Group I thaumarchaeote SCGC AAA799-B03]